MTSFGVLPQPASQSTSQLGTQPGSRPSFRGNRASAMKFVAQRRRRRTGAAPLKTTPADAISDELTHFGAPIIPRASTCCTHMFGWVLHNPYAHDATHSSYSRPYFCPHALFLSPPLCVYACAHRTSFCPWLDAEGCLLLCQVGYQTLVAGPNPPDSPTILPVEAYCSKLPLQAHRYLGCVNVQCFCSSRMHDRCPTLCIDQTRA